MAKHMAIVLTYDSAMAAGQDAGNRSMRKANRTAWNDDDFNVSVATVERMAATLYRAEHPDVVDVPLDHALYELQLTRGRGCAAFVHSTT